jgi:putative ABC transport system permease protein
VWGVRAMNAGPPPNTLPITDIGIDSTVLFFALAVTLATGVLFGLAPAWQTARTDLNTVLKQGSRSSAGGTRPILRNLLVGGELALATVLLIGAGLLMQSLFRLQQVQFGFRSDRLMTFQLSPPPAKYPPPAKAWALYRDLLDSLRTIPGVRAAAVSSGIPFGGGNYTTTPTAPVGKSVLPEGESIPIEWRGVSPDYFRTLEIPLIRGRTFGDQDATSGPLTAIISQQTASRLFGLDNPLDRQIKVVGSGRVFTVVGVVGGVRTTALNRELVPAMYFPAALRVWPLMDIVVRTEGRPESVLSAIRQKVRALDAELPVSNVRTMDEWVSNNAATPRLNGVLFAIFAGVALIIAGIGIYGVLSYSVNQRTREIGVRLALGAQPVDVLRMVVREGMLLAFAGIAAGLGGAVLVSRALATLLFGIEARDPATFAGVAVVLIAIALTACYIPARRATRVDPVIALRYE